MNKKEAQKKVAAMQKNVKVFAQKELTKAKAEMAKAAKKVEAFVKKNPEKAAIISAGIGAAIGAAVAALIAKKRK
jgi:ElaB/YqjD/DUF883 family membrane-anchored ribosome-binding protein